MFAAAEWQAAMEALILVATSGGPTMFARIGVMRALNRHVERVFNPDQGASVPLACAAESKFSASKISPESCYSSGAFFVSRLLVSFQRSVAREPLVTLFTQLI